jgi:hypothetical protein
VLALELIDLIDRADMRMIERRRRSGFALKTIERLRILFRLGRQKFKSYLASQPEIFGLIDDAHPAATQAAQDTVTRNLCKVHGTPRSCDLRSDRSARSMLYIGAWLQAMRSFLRAHPRPATP